MTGGGGRSLPEKGRVAPSTKYKPAGIVGGSAEINNIRPEGSHCGLCLQSRDDRARGKSAGKNTPI